MNAVDSKGNLEKVIEHSQEDFDELFEYLKSVLNINKTISSTFMGITLTAFIFLISLGYPDILDEIFVIGFLSIKLVPFSLIYLVLSFFFCLISTFLYHFCELKLHKLYRYWPANLTLSDRYEKSEKLFKAYNNIFNVFLFYGVVFLIFAVIFIFLNFAAVGIFTTVIIFSSIGVALGTTYLYPKIKKFVNKKRKS